MIKSLGFKTMGLGLLVILTLAGFFVAGQVPVLGAIMAGIPAFLVVLAWGGVWFTLYGAITLTLTSLLGNSSLAILMVPMIMLPSAVLSGSIKFKLPPLRALGFSILGATVLSTILWGASMQITQDEKNVFAFRKQFKQQVLAVEKQLDKLEKEGVESAERIGLVKENLRQAVDFMIMLIPVTFIFIWHLISLTIFYYSALKLAPKFGFELPALPEFSNWKLDWNLIWFYIVGWFLFYGINGIEALPAKESLRMIGANCLAIGKTLYFIGGLSLLFFMFEKYKIGPLTKVGLSCLALVLTQAIVWLGIIDIWADFRTPKPALLSEDSNDDL